VAEQALGEITIGILVALVAQELDTCHDRLLDLITDRAGGRVVVLAGETGGVDRLAEPLVERKAGTIMTR